MSAFTDYGGIRPADAGEVKSQKSEVRSQRSEAGGRDQKSAGSNKSLHKNLELDRLVNSDAV